MEITIYLALIAGVVSFISPCVLPLVPAYIGYMGGRVTHTVALSTGQTIATSRSQRLSTLTHGLFFVMGFTFVFVALGLLSTAFVSVIGGRNISIVTDMIGRIGGIVIIFFGLQFMGVLPALFTRLRANQTLMSNALTGIGFALIGAILIIWGFTGTLVIWDIEVWELAVWPPILGLMTLAVFLMWLFLAGAFTTPAQFWNRTLNRLESALYADTRRQMTASADRGYASSALMGVIFSAGWTPCIGPVYGAVLTMAANDGNIAQAGLLLTAYSLGLGVPFLLTAFMLDSAQGILRGLQRNMRRIELASGAFLVLIGVLVASGQLQHLSQQFSGQFAEFSIGVEESVIDFVTGGSLSQQQFAAPEATTDGLLTIPQIDAEAVEPILIPDDTSGIDPGALAAAAPSVGTAVGNIAPQFETTNHLGQPVRLADLRGQIVLLNFWATWCGPCRVEMPEFEAAYNEYKDDGFTILAVNNSEPVGVIQSFRDELGLTFPLLMDESGTLQRLYSIVSYPSTFLLDREGRIIARHFGPLTTAQIQQMVAEALSA